MTEAWYDLTHDEEYCRKNFLSVNRADFLGTDFQRLSDGKTIHEWNPNSSYRSSAPDADREPDDVLIEHLGLPVFSPRLQSALRDARIAENDIQYLPVKIFRSNGDEIHGFAIANIVTRIEALDRTHTDMLDEDPNKIDSLTGKPKVKGIWTPAIKSELVAGHDMFRLAEFFPIEFVSDRFVKLFKKHGFTGTAFRKVIVV